jgi:hypothetical protein
VLLSPTFRPLLTHVAGALHIIAHIKINYLIIYYYRYYCRRHYVEVKSSRVS